MIRLLGLLLSLTITAYSHAGNGFVFLKDTTKQFYVADNEIYSPDKNWLLFFSKGNIFFTGENDARQNIFLYCTSMNPLEEKWNTIQLKEERQPAYSYYSGKFYTGQVRSEAEAQQKELLHVQRSGKWMAFYSSINDSLLAYYLTDSLPNSTAIIVAYSLIERYDLLKQLKNKYSAIAAVQPAFSSIKPMWGNTTANEWIWDGKILRPRWNNNPQLGWTFDGKTIKPYWGNNIYEQYEWDGEYFRPVWRTNRNLEWQWDGRIFKPVWDTDWKNQYTISSGIIKPWSNVHAEREWQMEGDIPIPLVILIISGIARPM